MPVITSMNPSDWKEDLTEAMLRENLTPQSSPVLVRRLFPLKGRLTRYCRVRQMPVGTLLNYVRTKQAPSFYPLETCVIQDGQVYKTSYASDEMDLVPEWAVDE